MTKLLLMGAGPMPYEPCKRLSAHGSRTWQFAQPLVEAGHELVVVCLKDHGAYPPGSPPVEVRHENGMTVHALDVASYEKPGALQKIHDDFRPDGIVTSASLMPSCFAATLETDAPIWIDQNGDSMAEAQMLAAVRDDDEPLTLYAAFLAPALARGDVFSAQSARQRYALIGQLAAQGRLNKETVQHEFVHVLPDAFEGSLTATRDVIRGVLCGKEDFVILWSGGFNTWVDVETLFDGLEKAMAADPAIRFVSTGGGLPGLVQSQYDRFQERVKRSGYRDRFHLMGWVERADVANYVLEADLGITIDRPCYETELGSRTRLLSWWSAGLPALSTNGCELTDVAAQAGALATFPQGDAAGLAEAIIALKADPARRKAIAEQASTLVSEQFSFAATTKPLLDWVASPTHAPDYRAGGKRPGLDVELMSALERKAGLARDQLEAIRSSRTWRIASRVHALTRWLGLK